MWVGVSDLFGECVSCIPFVLYTVCHAIAKFGARLRRMDRTCVCLLAC
jgi:hypothetical protein